jgi:hypothetical protein
MVHPARAYIGSVVPMTASSLVDPGRQLRKSPSPCFPTDCPITISAVTNMLQT